MISDNQRKKNNSNPLLVEKLKLLKRIEKELDIAIEQGLIMKQWKKEVTEIIADIEKAIEG